MDYKKLLYFLGGSVVGGIAGFFIAKRKFLKELQDVIEEEMGNRYNPEDLVTVLDVGSDTIDKHEEAHIMVSKNEKVNYNEIKKAEMAKSIFGNPDEIHEDLKKQLAKAKEEAKEPEMVSWKNNTKKPESISPEQFLNEEDGIIKAADPLIYFAGDGVLINTEDDICEPFSDEFLKDYFNIKESITHLGEWGEPDVMYLRCYEEPITDYKIICKDGTFEESPWYPGEV